MNYSLKYSFLIIFILIVNVLSFAIERNFQFEYNNYKNETLKETNVLAGINTIMKKETSFCQNSPDTEFTVEVSKGKTPYIFTNQIDTTFNQNIQNLRKIDAVQVPTNISEKKRSDTISCKKDTTKNVINPIISPKLNVIDGPTVSFSFNTDNTCAGTTVKFTSEVSGKGPFTYTWDFGDGQTSTAKDPTHEYNSLGCGTETFTIGLTVTDADTIPTAVNKTIIIKQQPDISFTDVNSPFDPFSNCSNASITNPNYSITVDNNSPSTCITSYTLDWGDGSSLVSNVTFPIEHTYNTLGGFDMVITAFGTNGCNISKKYIVKNQTNPSGGLISPGTTLNLCAPTDKLEFEIAKWGANSPGTIYEVDYGDNSPKLTLTQEELIASSYYSVTAPASSENFPIPHIYNTSNCPNSQFVTTLTVKNACAITTFTADNITVLNMPGADFTVPPSCTNSNVLFTNTTVLGNGINCVQDSKFAWDFGDGTTIVENTGTVPKNVTHIFTTPGIYNITLSSENFCGKTVKTKQVTISLPPTATISGGANVCLGDTPPSVTFTGANGTAPYKFTYKINNGSNRTVTTSAGSNSVTIEALTNTAGTFTYSLISVSASSCSQSQTGTAVIIVKSAPTATISGTDELCLNDPEPVVTFTGANETSPYIFTYNINGGSNQTITTTTGNTVTLKVPTNKDGVYKYNLLEVKDAGASTCSMPQTGAAIITINEKPPAPVTMSDVEYCNGETTPAINFGNNLPGLTYEWTNSNSSIGLAMSGTGNIQPFTAKNSSTSSITSTVTLVASLNGCESDSVTFTITVHPSASVTFSEPDQIICSGETTAKVLLSSSTPGAGLSWSTEQPVGILYNIPLSGTTTIESETLINTTNAPIFIVYKAKATLSGATQCSGIEYNYTITVNPKPEVSHNYTDTICSGATFNISPENGGGNVIPSGTRYTWSKPVINPVGSITGASEQNAPQLSVSQTLVINTSVIGTATYSVTPVIDNCPVDPFEIIIYLIPGTVIDPITDIILCSGDVNKEIDLGTPPEGTRFKWSTNIINIGFHGSSGYDKIPDFTATNNGVSPIVANIKVESESVGDSDCETMPVQFSITVNPRPEVGHNYTDTICSSTTFNISPENGGGNVIPSGTKYTWSKPVIYPSGSITGASGQDMPQASISQALVNTSTFIATATYRIIPTTIGCTGESFDLIVYIIPGATLPFVSDITLCDEETNEEINFGNPPEGKVYNWISDNKDIGLPGFSGTGNISKFNAVNNGTTPIVAKIIVTPEGDFGSSICSGTQVQFSVTVNPTPRVNNPGDIMICSEEEISINFNTDNTGGTSSYEWTNSNSDIGLATSGDGNISFSPINTGDAVATTLVIVTPFFESGGVSCKGATEQFSITVNPTATIDQPADQTICSGNKTSEIIFSGNNPNIIYNWSINNNSIGLPSNGTSDIPEFLVKNNEYDSVVAIVTVVPSLNGCDGTPKNFSIIVHPAALVLKHPSPSTICLGDKPTPLSVIHTNGVGTPFYQWFSNTSNSTIGGTKIPNENSSSYYPPSEFTNAMYYYCVISFSSGGCSNLTTEIAKVTVNPNPVIVLNDEKISRGDELKICPNEEIPIRVRGADTYNWSYGFLGDNILLSDIGDYRVIGTSELGCKDTFPFSASYYDSWNYTIESDREEVTYEQSPVSFSTIEIPGSFYNWDFGDGTTAYGNKIEHIFDITKDGYFDVILTVENPHGCIEKATKQIQISITSIPNTFTPNGDGINDFYLEGWYKKIFNRNGILLYEGEEAWDGTYRGKSVANDTYFVVLYDSSEFGAKYLTNYVTVLR